MNRQKKRRHSHVVVRLPGQLRSQLEQDQNATGARSIAPVVQEILFKRIVHGKKPGVCRRNPIDCDQASIFLRAELVDLVRSWARDSGGSIGDMVFTLLAEEYDSRVAAGR
jgi:hypothetical protein